MKPITFLILAYLLIRVVTTSGLGKTDLSNCPINTICDTNGVANITDYSDYGIAHNVTCACNFTRVEPSTTTEPAMRPKTRFRPATEYSVTIQNLTEDQVHNLFSR